MNYKYLRVRIDYRVGWLEYNFPPINAFNWDMLREVPAALQALLDDPQVRVVVYASAIEKYFTEGGALSFEEGLEIEYQSAVRLAGTEDFAEGICAFLEKRKPHWK